MARETAKKVSIPEKSMGAKELSFCLVILNLVLDVWGSPDFIKTACEVTRYPVGCVQSLSSQASSIGQSDQQLALTALSVSASRTQSCASFLKTLSQADNAVRGCVGNIDGSVDRLTQSVKELELAGKPNEDSAMHISNAQTWVGVAITDQTTCQDALDGPNIDAQLKEAVRPRVMDASQATSNALALINRFATKQEAAPPIGAP
ncbi:21 kDa protein [Cajanus cajan]|nr:21 kDa protein [Cajanus cajan]